MSTASAGPKEAQATPKKAESKKSEAGVNWEGQVIKATGSGAPDMKAANPAQARLGAERAAQMDAFRNLLEQVKGIQISAGRTVGDAMASNDEIRGKVEGVIRGFKITAKRYFSDSGVEIDVEVPLAALTGALVPTGESGVALKTEGAQTNTGLVVDARGIKDLSPALAPRLVDESGKAVYAADVLSEEARKAYGVAAWAKSIEDAKKSERVGAHPLVVKAARATGSDLVLSADDVKKLGESNNSYLAEGRVIIVTQ
ncbi:MAG: LPP20 family lipoprotein [Myxococcaceae bacterium]|nr:LPP20 family lipoprotein [Myxococcaceae bacterium]